MSAARWGEETVGYLGLSLDGQPYVVPLNYAYATGKILFHCALTGKKLYCLRAIPATWTATVSSATAGRG